MTKNEPKRLYRNTKDAKIAGVCAGIADYLNVDVTVVRVIFIVLLIPGGFPGFIPYVLLWIIMPTKQDEKPKG